MKFSLKKLGKISNSQRFNYQRFNYQRLITNKYILYLVLFLSGIFLFSLLLAKKMNLIILFALIGYIIWFYNKNMTIVLGLSLILTFIANLGVKVKEGMDNQSSDDKEKDKEKEKEKDDKNNLTTKTKTDTETPTPKESKPPESMNNISGGKRNRIDYASTVEDAYDDLSKILGGDGIKRLTGDTQQLLEQQVQLVDAMKTMTPLIETAKGLLNGLNMDGLNGLTDIAEKIMPKK
jgi:hypothetical protein